MRAAGCTSRRSRMMISLSRPVTNEDRAPRPVDGEEALVAGAQPAVGVEGARGGLRVAEVAEHRSSGRGPRARPRSPPPSAPPRGVDARSPRCRASAGPIEGTSPPKSRLPVLLGGRQRGRQAAGEVRVLGQAPALDQRDAGACPRRPGQRRRAAAPTRPGCSASVGTFVARDAAAEEHRQQRRHHAGHRRPTRADHLTQVKGSRRSVKHQVPAGRAARSSGRSRRRARGRAEDGELRRAVEAEVLRHAPGVREEVAAGAGRRPWGCRWCPRCRGRWRARSARSRSRRARRHARAHGGAPRRASAKRGPRRAARAASELARSRSRPRAPRVARGCTPSPRRGGRVERHDDGAQAQQRRARAPGPRAGSARGWRRDRPRRTPSVAGEVRRPARSTCARSSP